MGVNPALPRKVSEVLNKYGWDIEYFKGFILGLVWLDLFRENSRYEAFLDIAAGALSEQEDEVLGEYALYISHEIEMERYRFSAGCKVNEKSFAANYRKEHKLFQWACGVNMACRILEVMLEDGDVERESANLYILDKIAETVFPFLDKQFALDFFSEINEAKMTTGECLPLLVKLRNDLPSMIRDITLSSQMISEIPTFDDDDEPFDGPIGNIHGHFIGVTNIYDVNDVVDDLLPRVMAGNKTERLKNVKALLGYSEKALGEEFFVQNKGHFWGVHESRTYMRVLTALAEVYRSTLQGEKAIECYEKSLELCEHDNLGARYLLADLYMELRRVDDALALIAKFKDASAMMLFTKALALFLKMGYSSEAKKGLKAAMKSNGFVVPMLLDIIPIPKELPEYYGLGDENEAILYVAHNRLLWRNTPGALEWLLQK